MGGSVFLIAFFFSSGLWAATDLFLFSPPKTCEELFRHQSYCIATRPLEWSPEDESFVRSELQNLLERPHVRTVIERIVEDQGPVQIYRNSYGYQPKNLRLFRRAEDTIAWVDFSRNRSIHLTHRFFQTRSQNDEGFSFETYTLLHELAHKLDKAAGRISRSEEFHRLFDWQEVDDPNSHINQWMTSGVSPQQVQEVLNEAAALISAGRAEEGRQLNFGFSASYGLPTTYSMVNPQESYAEIITGYLLNPELVEMVDPDKLAWVLERSGLD